MRKTLGAIVLALGLTFGALAFAGTAQAGDCNIDPGPCVPCDANTCQPVVPCDLNLGTCSPAPVVCDANLADPNLECIAIGSVRASAPARVAHRQAVRHHRLRRAH